MYSVFAELIQVWPVSKSKLLRIVVAELLQAGCPSCHATISVKALKDICLHGQNYGGWGDKNPEPIPPNILYLHHIGKWPLVVWKH